MNDYYDEVLALILTPGGVRDRMHAWHVLAENNFAVSNPWFDNAVRAYEERCNVVLPNLSEV